MSLGIPYMGSKRRLSGKILDYICAQNPNATHFYDLFGGGGAISFEALQRPQFECVTYNELNTGVVELLRKIQRDGVTDEFYRWVSRETFQKHKNDDTWYGGLLKTCWSFGSNQREYLYGKHIEREKMLADNVVVRQCLKSSVELSKIAEIDIKVSGKKTINERKKDFAEAIRKSGKRFDLEKLQRLNGLERLERLERLEIKNLSYESVKIETPPEQTVIYCDPPYFGTEKYQNTLNHREFYDWVNRSPYKIYVSSYESELPCVLEMAHRSTLSATANNKVVERLFCSKPENSLYQLF